jgi:hypothetical protein
MVTDSALTLGRRSTMPRDGLSQLMNDSQTGGAQ